MHRSRLNHAISKAIRNHIRGNLIGYIALFFALSTGGAVALSGSNTVQSDDLGPGAQVTAPDVAANAVNGSDVVDNSLTGSDVNEAGLDATPLRTRVAQGGCSAVGRGNRRHGQGRLALHR